MIKGRSKDFQATKLISEAMLCKAFKCRPSELKKEKWEDIEKVAYVFFEMIKKDPMVALM